MAWVGSLTYYLALKEFVWRLDLRREFCDHFKTVHVTYFELCWAGRGHHCCLGCLPPHTCALCTGPVSSASPSRRAVPWSRYTPPIAVPGTGPVDSPRLHSRGTTACCHRHFGVASHSGSLSGAVRGDAGPSFVALRVGRADRRLECTSLSLWFVGVGTLR